jgi:sterol desaturase/sphingolipid hydroxylase (fatty acid hydroxylase superfamily)
MSIEIWVSLGLLLLSNHIFVAALPGIYRVVLPAGQDRRVYSVAHDPEQTRREWVSSLITTPLPPLIIGISIYSGLLRVDMGAEGLLSGMLTFLAIFVWSEVWHYYSHLAMHSRWLIKIHRFHHVSRLPRPMTCLSFSVTEKSMLSIGILAPAWIASQWLPSGSVSFYGILAYYFLYFFTNAVGHFNLEAWPVGYTLTYFGRVFTAATFHVMHHSRYTNNFGLMTTFLDRWHGTMWADYPQVLDRAASGQPLRAFDERPLVVPEARA